MKSVRYLLKEVKNLLMKKGWIQDDYQRAESYCMVGAINTVLHSYRDGMTLDEWMDTRRGCMTTVLDTINESCVGTKYSTVEGWNDSRATDESDIYEVLDKAIDRSKVEEVIEESRDIEIEEPVIV